jgi:hypothetical protein
MVKTGAASLIMLALLMPVTRQFFLPFLPILTWLVFFFNARYVYNVSVNQNLSAGLVLLMAVIDAITNFCVASYLLNTDLISGSKCYLRSKTYFMEPI